MEWSKTPPSEPGWYWWYGQTHADGSESKEIVEVVAGRAQMMWFAAPDVVDWLSEGEWWTTPIEEPPR